MSDSYDKDRLGKIVALAKGGTGGEKENAIRIVRKICADHNLDFDAVMEDVALSEYTFDYANAIEEQLLPQILQKYCKPFPDRRMDILFNSTRKLMFIKTTKEKYVEGVNAWDVLRKLYRVEKKKMERTLLFAFLDKHHLYYDPTPEERADAMRAAMMQSDPDEMVHRRRGRKLASELEDANLQKRLGPETK